MATKSKNRNQAAAIAKLREPAIARLRELRPDLPSPSFGDALAMLCHCGEKLDEHCECNAEAGTP